MATVRGTVSWGIQPWDWNNSNLAGAFWRLRTNALKSVNDPLRYQIQWFAAGLTEGVEPSAANFDSSLDEGDLVSVIFTVSIRSGLGLDWREIGVIKKSRDIASKHFKTQNPANGHRFTIDVSALVANELSYSLCPINKGTWQVNHLGNNYYGGMNGGVVNSDNVIGNSGAAGSPISHFNISPNGTMVHLRVETTYEIVKEDGTISTSTDQSGYSNIISVINSVNQFEKDSLYYHNTYSMGNSASTQYSFLSRCPNFTTNASPLTYDFQKPVRIDEQAEYLQFYIREGNSLSIGSGGQSTVGAIGLKVETFEADGSAENTFYLRDFEDNLLTGLDGGKVIINTYQQGMFIQNISPYYINNTAALKAEQDPIDRDSFPYWNTYSGDKITSSTAYYRVSMSRFSLWANYAERRTSNYRYYTIDREDENIPYGFVRFHWLNSLGGIDSYTAKRDVAEGLTISRDVIERKSGDRTWYQDIESNGSTMNDGIFISDTMRGGNIYKGGREVTNVNAEKNKSVYTEPLNKSMAEWLKEIMLSPNVWIEMDTNATAMGNTMNSHLRPSTKGYIPVIITNSDIETVNQEEGLVKFNIEYTLAHKVITQRN
jgi:hypothetical protein